MSALGPSPQDLAELDARVARGAAITREAVALAAGLDHGTVSVQEARGFLEQDFLDGQPYVDLKELVAALMRIERARYCSRLETE